MNKELIEQIAREQWNNLHEHQMFHPGEDTYQYEYFLKGIEAALSMYKFTEIDMLNMAGRTVAICNTMTSQRIVDEIKEVIAEYEVC